MKNEMIIGILLCGIIGVSIGFVIMAVPVENIKKMEIKNREPNMINYTNFTLLLAVLTVILIVIGAIIKIIWMINGKKGSTI